MNPLAVQTSRGAGETKACRELSAFASTDKTLNEQLTTGQHPAVSLLGHILHGQVAVEEPPSTVVDHVEVVHLLGTVDEVPVAATFQCSLDSRAARRVGEFTPVECTGDVVHDRRAGKRESRVVEETKDRLHGRHSWTPSAWHRRIMRVLCTSTASLCRKYDECNVVLMELSISYLSEDSHGSGNDCRSALGRDKVNEESAPVKGHFAVVRTQSMNPNDRTRTNGPGMDNCIGYNHQTARGVAA